ncbi:MAG: DNA recombination protein RmuC, partial [Clostridia bacterium]
MVAWINQNAGVALVLSALLVALVLGGILYVRLRRIERAMNERLAGSEKFRRRQYADLVERVDRSNERLNHDLQMVNQLMTVNAQSGEERIDRLLERMSMALEQQQKQMTEMRGAVDAQLKTTLETRLGESFRQVSEQLERVYKGLGEMQTLAGGVGDLKRMLAGVKTRGVWGEVRLAALLEDSLTSDQYLVNTPVEPGGKERVEFAVKLPGKIDGQPVLLPIDAKFPQEDYQRLIDAQVSGDRAASEQSALALEKALLTEGKRISDKYIRVPHTTDFAVLFLPIEGLYAEALRRPELQNKLHTQYRVLLSGPATLSALLNSLQMGFKTLAVEQRSEEIWRLLGAVRGEFLKFGEALDRTRQRLDLAGQDLDAASTRTRQITRQLAKVEEMPV